MNTVQYNSRWFRNAAFVVAIASCAMVPAATMKADDDWEDRWEDYQDALEDQREEAEERWEEEREAIEDWREDREEAYEELQERQIIVPRYGRRHDYRPQRYWEEPLPPPRYYGYQDRQAPVYRYHDWEEPRVYRYYGPRRPTYRYYGTGDVGYTEHGRHRSVRVGPFHVHWDR